MITHCKMPEEELNYRTVEKCDGCFETGVHMCCESAEIVRVVTEKGGNKNALMV